MLEIVLYVVGALIVGAMAYFFGVNRTKKIICDLDVDELDGFLSDVGGFFDSEDDSEEEEKEDDSKEDSTK